MDRVENHLDPRLMGSSNPIDVENHDIERVIDDFFELVNKTLVGRARKGLATKAKNMKQYVAPRAKNSKKLDNALKRHLAAARKAHYDNPASDILRASKEI